MPSVKIYATKFVTFAVMALILAFVLRQAFVPDQVKSLYKY